MPFLAHQLLLLLILVGALQPTKYSYYCCVDVLFSQLIALITHIGRRSSAHQILSLLLFQCPLERINYSYYFFFEAFFSRAITLFTLISRHSLGHQLLLITLVLKHSLFPAVTLITPIWDLFSPLFTRINLFTRPSLAQHLLLLL